MLKTKDGKMAATASTTKKEEKRIILPIRCSLRKIPEYSLLSETSKTKFKDGRYHGSSFPDKKGKGIGISCWPVACYIDFESGANNFIKAGWKEEEIIEGLLKYLNEVPDKKKYAKKEPEPKYGRLECYSFKFKKDSDTQDDYIEMLLLTDDKNNGNFWNSGEDGMKKSQYRGRPRNKK